jgi:hypothetical protein
MNVNLSYRSVALREYSDRNRNLKKSEIASSATIHNLNIHHGPDRDHDEYLNINIKLRYEWSRSSAKNETFFFLLFNNISSF